MINYLIELIKFEVTGNIRDKDALTVWKKRYDNKFRELKQNTNAHSIVLQSKSFLSKTKFNNLKFDLKLLKTRLC